MSAHGDELVRRAKARLGKVVDEKWRMDALLGVGGMAAVYAATHRNGKRGALKILHPEVALDTNVKARFLREGYLANKVDHPGAVSILDDDEAPDGSVYLVMELLEGETLEQRCRGGAKLAVGDALVLADQTLEVLVVAHGKNIIHRDLKPGNLFLTADGLVKVLDFGIAQLRELTAGPPSQARAGQVAPGPMATTMSSMGTPGFMPPEQARGRWDEVDRRADLWALGATLFNAMTSRYVHDEGTLNEQLLAAMTKHAPPIRTIDPEIPEPVATVIDRALFFEKEKRWPDAQAMKDAVREAYLQITGRSLSFSRRIIIVPRTSVPGSAPDGAQFEDEEDEHQSVPTLGVMTDSPTPDFGTRPKPPVGATTTNGATISDGAFRREEAGARRRRAVLLGGGAVLVALLAFAFGRGAHEAPKQDVLSATPAVAPPDAPTALPPSSAAPSSSLAGAGSVPSGVTAATSGSTTSSGPHTPKRTTSSAAPPASASTAVVPVSTVPTPPADSVDIFGKRR